MAGERGPINISQVDIGGGVRVVKRTGFQYEPSEVTGTVVAQSEGVVAIRLTRPRVLTENAHLRMIVPGSFSVFELAEQACKDERPDSRVIAGSSGHVLPPGIF